MRKKRPLEFNQATSSHPNTPVSHPDPSVIQETLNNVEKTSRPTKTARKTSWIRLFILISTKSLQSVFWAETDEVDMKHVH